MNSKSKTIDCSLVDMAREYLEQNDPQYQEAMREQMRRLHKDGRKAQRRLLKWYREQQQVETDKHESM